MRRVKFRVLALLGYALLCVALATPTGSRLSNRRVWDSQHNQDEFDAWARGLNGLGFDVSGQEFQDLLWSFTNTYLKQRQLVLGPVEWAAAQLGFTQSWRMFSNPQTSPSRLWVELDTGYGFTPLFVAGSEQYTWRRDFFAHHRIRKLLGRIGRAGRAPEYDALCKWLATEAAREFPNGQFPNAVALRISMYTWKTPPPNHPFEPPSKPELARPGGKFERRKLLQLAEFRP